MPHLRRLLIASALIAATQPAIAAPAASAASEPEEIVVRGTRATGREISRFVDALTPAPVRGQIGRFDWAVCPASIGLSDGQNRAVETRLRAVANAAGMPVGGFGCRPNAFVIATHDKAELIDVLAAKFPDYFKDPLGGAVKIPKQDGPATAWHVEGLLDADGVPVPVDHIEKRYVAEGTRTSSRISTATRPHFIHAILVVELEALRGLTTTQLADYAAMRLFAKTDPSGLEKTSAPTILKVLEAPMDSEVPITLTEWDFGFLKALYASSLNHYASSQRGEIQRRLSKDLKSGKAADVE